MRHPMLIALLAGTTTEAVETPTATSKTVATTTGTKTTKKTKKH